MSEPGRDRYQVARTVLAGLPCPVVIVAAAAGGERSCATGTAMYASFAPPALAIAMHPTSRTYRLLEASGEFSVSLLAQEQVQAAVIGGRASREADKLDQLGLGVAESDRSGAPGVAAAPLIAWCRVSHQLAVGDHVLVVGTVVDQRLSEAAAPPLLRHQRRYASRGPWLSDELSEGYPT